MMSNYARNEMLLMVLTDLAGICQKLAENSAVPVELGLKAREYVDTYNELSLVRGSGAAAHAQGEKLLIQMARFLPTLLEVQASPAMRAS